MTIDSTKEEKYKLKLTVRETIVWATIIAFVSMIGTMFAYQS